MKGLLLLLLFMLPYIVKFISTKKSVTIDESESGQDMASADVAFAGQKQGSAAFDAAASSTGAVHRSISMDSNISVLNGDDSNCAPVDFDLRTAVIYQTILQNDYYDIDN